MNHTKIISHEQRRLAAASKFAELARRFTSMAELLQSETPLPTLPVVALHVHAAYELQKLAKVGSRIASWRMCSEEVTERLTFQNPVAGANESTTVDSHSLPEAP
jgi:hypothetical protein